MHQLRSGTAVFSTDPNGRIVDWNAESERLMGIGVSDAVGHPCWEVIGGSDAEGGVVCHPGCSLARLAREGWPVGRIDVQARAAGGPKRLTLSTIVLRDDDRQLILHTMQPEVDVAPSSDDGIVPLTPRQRQILVLLAQGVRARQIAARLMLSETTVRNHIQAILVTLGVHSQLEAVARARALLVVDDEPVV